MKKGTSGSRRSGLDAATWSMLLDFQEGGDLSVKDFCVSQDLSVASFYQWRGRLPPPLLLSPSATAAATFNENVMVEINIDNTGDNVEDLVIQAIKRGSKMYFFGPVAPGTTGVSSTVKTASPLGSVEISQYGSAPIIASQNGMKFFAGPRDDPFFFDLGQFKSILMGTATGFNNPGTDTFAGTNVLSTIIEVPKSMLGSSSTINVWSETKQKQ